MILLWSFHTYLFLRSIPERCILELSASSPSTVLWAFHTIQPSSSPCAVSVNLAFGSVTLSCLPSGIFIHPDVWPQQTWAENWRLCLFGGAGSPSKTMWRGSRPTSMPSGILVYPTVWPQYNNVTDRTGRIDRTGQQSDSIGRTVLQTVTQKNNENSSGDDL